MKIHYYLWIVIFFSYLMGVKNKSPTPEKPLDLIEALERVMHADDRYAKMCRKRAIRIRNENKKCTCVMIQSKYPALGKAIIEDARRYANQSPQSLQEFKEDDFRLAAEKYRSFMTRKEKQLFFEGNQEAQESPLFDEEDFLGAVLNLGD